MKKVYWKHECKYCKSKEKCPYIKDTEAFREMISSIANHTHGVYGSLSFRCDYHILDEELYCKDYPPECACRG